MGDIEAVSKRIIIKKQALNVIKENQKELLDEPMMPQSQMNDDNDSVAANIIHDGRNKHVTVCNSLFNSRLRFEIVRISIACVV